MVVGLGSLGINCGNASCTVTEVHPSATAADAVYMLEHVLGLLRVRGVHFSRVAATDMHPSYTKQS